MIKMTSNPFRWILALVLAPVAPIAVLWVANFGREHGERAGSIIVSLMASEPWIAVAFAAMGPAMLVGMLVCILMPRKLRKPLAAHANADTDCRK